MRIALAIAAALACAAQAFAQPNAAPRDAIPRDAEGHPDFGGVWDADFLTPLERPDGLTTLIIPPEGAADALKKMGPDFGKVFDPDLNYFFPNTLLTIDGAYRSSWIVEPADGKLPTTALAKSVAKSDESFSRTGFDNPEERPASERCISSLVHAPLHSVSRVIPSVFVQTPGAILIFTEDTDGARIIHIGGAMPPDAVRTRAGYSRGRWEGDTLVVVTTNFAADDPSGAIFRDVIPLTRASTVTEWFSFTAKDELRLRFTVEDPALFDRPWLAEYALMRLDDNVYEYACHEGNHAMPNILRAARMGLQKPPKPDPKPADKK